MLRVSVVVVTRVITEWPFPAGPLTPNASVCAATASMLYQVVDVFMVLSTTISIRHRFSRKNRNKEDPLTC